MKTTHRDKEANGKTRNTEEIRDLPAFLSCCLPFFALCFVYFWLVVRPDLIYYCFGTILSDASQFAAGWSFLRDCAGTPGGLAAYVSGFLSQGYCHAWLGAAIIVLAGLCLAQLTRWHLKTAGLVRAWVPACLPAIMLFLIYNRYKHPLTVGLTVSLGLLLSLVFQKLPWRRPSVRVGVCSLMAMVAFWLGGGGTLLVFALMTAVHGPGRLWTASDPERDRVKCAPYELLALPAGLAIAWVLAEYVFLIPGGEALLILTPFSTPVVAAMDAFLKTLTFLLYGFAPLAVLLTLVGKKLFGGREPTPNVATPKKHPAPQRKRTVLASVWKPAMPAIPVVLMVSGLYFGRDELRKPYVLSNYYSRSGQWEKVLELGGRLPKGKNNIFVNHDIVRALYHTGRLPYDMFHYPQNPQALLLTHERQESDLTQLKLCDLFLEMGHVNVAQKLASELLSTKGHFGFAIEKLAWINIIKGCPLTAKTYLNALKADLAYRETAKTLLHGLDHGFNQDQAAHIDTIRSYAHNETTGVTFTEPVDETLTALLKRNPHNKMAFEYLMACYLLTGQVEKIAENVHRLNELGYQGIPTLYEEALLIYYGSKKLSVDLSRSGIRPETFRRYQTFVQIANAVQPQNQQAVLNRLIREFGTTYFFFFSFGRVGLT